QNSSNSSRPPSWDPPQVLPKRAATPTGRKRGGQPGHRGAFRALLPVEQVDEIVAVVPERCRQWPAISRDRTSSPQPGLAAPGGGVAAAGRASDRVPDGGAALPGLWEAHPGGPAGRRASAAVWRAPDRGDRSAEWSLPVEP